MNFEGINFNANFWKGKTLSYFMKQEAHHGLSADKMKEVFEILNPPASVKKPKKSSSIKKQN